jgi:SWI/SNF-related matrix-associated actin-dependent regulator of chromatin subfamily B protein 1
LAASVKEIPRLTDDEIADIKDWMQTDSAYEEKYKSMIERMAEECNTISRTPEWWERDEHLAMAAINRKDKFSIGLSSTRIARRKTGSRLGIRL